MGTSKIKNNSLRPAKFEKNSLHLISIFDLFLIFAVWGGAKIEIKTLTNESEGVYEKTQVPVP